MKVALLQMRVGQTPAENLETARQMLQQAAAGGAELVMLPEMFCCPYETPNFPKFAEPEGGARYQRLSALAREHSIYLVAGSMPEADGSRTYNTAYVFDRMGALITSYDKTHAFTPMGEQLAFAQGDALCRFSLEGHDCGLIICYDIRFPELARLMALAGAKVICIPAAFNMTTGPVHWELSFRARALDNQVYLLGCAPARDLTASYHSWGHSIVTDPWGTVTAQLAEAEGILFAELDLEKVETIRKELPLLRHRRTDVYELREVRK